THHHRTLRRGTAASNCPRPPAAIGRRYLSWIPLTHRRRIGRDVPRPCRSLPILDRFLMRNILSSDARPSRSVLLALALLLSTLSSRALHAQAASDVFLVALTKGANGWSVGVPANVSRFNGYDNQPAFAADARALFYTQVGADGQADIWRSDFGTGVAA